MSQPSMNQTDMGGLPSAVSWQLQLLAGVITLILGIILTVHGDGALNVICVILGLLLIIAWASAAKPKIKESSYVSFMLE